MADWTAEREFLVALQSEYLRLQEIVEKFDDRALTIKAWSVTLCTAGIGAGYIEARAALFAVSAVAAVMFWMVEAYWKTNQQAFYQRIYEIENASQEGVLDQIKPFRIGSSWSESWHKRHSEGAAWRRVCWWPHVALPHAGVAFLGAALLILKIVGAPIGI